MSLQQVPVGWEYADAGRKEVIDAIEGFNNGLETPNF